MAEWLGRALQKLLQRFKSARDLSSRMGGILGMNHKKKQNYLLYGRISYKRVLL